MLDPIYDVSAKKKSLKLTFQSLRICQKRKFFFKMIAKTIKSITQYLLDEKSIKQLFRFYQLNR